MALDHRPQVLPGTLDMLILKTLTAGADHGYGIARRIRQASREVILIEEGTLYPALHRLLKQGAIEASWGASDANRRARFYKLTARGRARLKTESQEWSVMAGAIDKVLNARAALSGVPAAAA